MTDLPHIDWPLRYEPQPDGATRLAVVEQDTPEELRASAAVIACTPRGARDDLPEFGVTSPIFEQGPIDTGRLAAEIAQSDPRPDIDASETLDLANATVRTVRVAVTPTS